MNQLKIMNPITRKINADLNAQGMFREDSILVNEQAIEIIDDAYTGYLLNQTSTFSKWVQEAKEFLEQPEVENSIIFKEIGKLFFEKFSDSNNLFLSRKFETKELSSRYSEEKWKEILKREGLARTFRGYWKKELMEEYHLIYNVRDKNLGNVSTGKSDIFVITITGLICIIQKYYSSPIHFRDLFGFSNKQLIGRDEDLKEFSEDYLELNSYDITEVEDKQKHFVIYGKSGIGKSELARAVIEKYSSNKTVSCIIMLDSRSLESANFTPYEVTTNIDKSMINSVKDSDNFIDFFDKLESLLVQNNIQDAYIILDQSEKLFENHETDISDLKGGIINTYKSSKLHRIHCIFITSEIGNLNEWWKFNVYKELKENITTYPLRPIDSVYNHLFQSELKLKLSLLSLFIEDIHILQNFRALIENESSRILNRIVELDEKPDQQLAIKPFYFHFYLNCLYDLFLGYTKKQDFSEVLSLFKKNPYDSTIEVWMKILLEEISKSNLLIKHILKIANEQVPINPKQLEFEGFNKKEIQHILDIFTQKRILGPIGKKELYFQHDLLLEIINDQINHIPDDIKQEFLRIKILEGRLEKLDSISPTDITVINRKYVHIIKYLDDEDAIDLLNTLLLYSDQQGAILTTSQIDSTLRYYSNLTLTDVPESNYKNLDMVLKRVLDSYKDFSEDKQLIEQIQSLIKLVSKVALFSNKSKLKLIMLLPKITHLKLKPHDISTIQKIIETEKISYEEEIETKHEIDVICKSLENNWKISDSKNIKSIIFSLSKRLSSLICSSILDVEVTSVQQLDNKTLVDLIAYVGNSTYNEAFTNFLSYISSINLDLNSIEPLLGKLDALKWVTIKILHPDKFSAGFINEILPTKLANNKTLLSLDILQEFRTFLSEDVKLEILKSLIENCSSVIHLGNIARSYKSIISENNQIELQLLNLLIENKIELYQHIITYDTREMKMFPELIQEGILNEILETNKEFIEIVAKLQINKQDNETIALDKLSLEILKGLTGLPLNQYINFLSIHFPEEILSFLISLINLEHSNIFYDYITADCIKSLNTIDIKYQKLFLKELISDKEKYARILTQLFYDNSYQINDFFVSILDSLNNEDLVEYLELLTKMIDTISKQELKYTENRYNSFISLFIETVNGVLSLKQKEVDTIESYKKLLIFLKTSNERFYLEKDISYQFIEAFHKIILHLNQKKKDLDSIDANLNEIVNLFLSNSKIRITDVNGKSYSLLEKSLQVVYNNDNMKDSLFSSIIDKQYPRYLELMTKIAYKLYPTKLENLFISMLTDETDSDLLSYFPNGIVEHLIETGKNEIKEIILVHLSYIIDNFDYFSPFGNVNNLLRKIGITKEEKKKLIKDFIEAGEDKYTVLFDKQIEDLRFLIKLIEDKKLLLNFENIRKTIPYDILVLLKEDEDALTILEKTLDDIEELEIFKALLEVYLDDYYFDNYERQLSFILQYINTNQSDLKKYAISRLFELFNNRKAYELTSYILKNEENIENLCKLFKEHYFLLQKTLYPLLFYILISSNLPVKIKKSISDFFSDFVFELAFWKSEYSFNIIGILIYFRLKENYKLTKKFSSKIFRLYKYIVDELNDSDFSIHNILEKVVSVLIRTSHVDIIPILFTDLEDQIQLLGTDFKRKLTDSYKLQVKDFKTNKQFNTIQDKEFNDTKVMSAIYWIMCRLFPLLRAHSGEQLLNDIIQRSIRKIQEYLNSSELYIKLIILNILHSWQSNLDEEKINSILAFESNNVDSSLLLLSQIFWRRKPFANFIKHNWIKLLKNKDGQKIIKKIMRDNLSMEQFFSKRVNSL